MKKEFESLKKELLSAEKVEGIVNYIMKKREKIEGLLSALESKINEVEKRMECAVRTSNDIHEVIGKFTYEVDAGKEIKMSVSELDKILLGSNDINIALDLEDTMCVVDDWFQLFREDKKQPQTHEFVKDIIAKLKVIDVDGETMQYILEQVGMSDQMLRQLVMSKPESDTKDLLEEKMELNLVNQK
jgi:hypothetical protein